MLNLYWINRIYYQLSVVGSGISCFEERDSALSSRKQKLDFLFIYNFDDREVSDYIIDCETAKAFGCAKAKAKAKAVSLVIFIFTNFLKNSRLQQVFRGAKEFLLEVSVEGSKMVLSTYKVQAEHLFRDYILADSRIVYTSIIGGICASKTVYDLSQVLSEGYFKSYSSLTKSQKIEWNNRIISTIHALLIATVSIYFVFLSDLYSGDSLAGSFCIQHSLSSTFALGASVGYFLSDIAMIFWFYPSLGGMEYVIHHLLAMVSLMYAILTGEGQYYTFMVLISETTTPSVNLRWYLEHAGMKNSRSYIVNGVVMFVSWLAARIVLFMYLFYHISAHFDQLKQMQWPGQYLILIAPSALAIMNVMWFLKIIKGLRKTLAKRH